MTRVGVIGMPHSLFRCLVPHLGLPLPATHAIGIKTAIKPSKKTLARRLLI
jgi:hypothetical protein